MAYPPALQPDEQHLGDSQQMTVEEALATVETVLNQEHLNKVQELVFRQAWEGQSYPEIGESSGYDPDYIRDVGSKLWQLLSKAFGERVTKKNFRLVLKRQLLETQAMATSPDKRGIDAPSQQSIRTLKQQSLAPARQQSQKPWSKIPNQSDWGDAVDVSIFYNRTEELAKLEQWIVKDYCRLVALLGMGGIGKTTLAVKLAEQLQDQFSYVIWRSLRNAPPVQEILTTFIQFLSGQEATNLPETIDTQLLRLIHYLRASRCLLILDDTESILRSDRCAGHYRAGYEGYGQLLRLIGETYHQSCLILTSREKPRELAAREGKTLPVRSLKLLGLQVADGRKIFQAKGSFSGSEDEWRILIEHYGGNPLALKMVAAGVQCFLDGSISKVVELLEQGTLVFDDIRHLLDRQFSRLCNLEKEIMCWLAIHREPASFAELQANFLPNISRSQILENLASLERRSLIEKSSIGFTQQPVIMDYVIEKVDRADLAEHIKEC